MTLQEKQLLTRFLEQLRGAQAGPKDVEAEALIKEAVARQPDAAYLLVQRAIQLEHLLAASQAEVEKLKAESESAQTGARGTSFLNDNYAWGRNAGSSSSAPIPGTSSAPIPGTRGAPVPPPAAMPAAAAAPAQRGSWGGGLFGNIASTAAGVVAGSFLFQGIQGLMHRSDTQTASNEFLPEHQAAASEPELLNSYDTYEDTGSDSLASGFDDDSSDFT
jgi:hypothetical protein